MRIVRVGEPGKERVGVLGDDATVRLVDEDVGDLVPERWNDVLRAARNVASGDGAAEVVELEPGVRLGPPVGRVGKIICIGLNYADHAREGGQPPPEEPIVFMKAPDTVTGPFDDIVMPPNSSKTDWEVELAVLIGADAIRLESPDAAWRTICGYAVANDLSERHFQLECGGQWDKGKNWLTFCPLGPYLVTADEVSTPQSLKLQLSVNDEPRQRSTTAEMLFSIDYLVWYVSRFIPLRPGDMLLTGTPAGVGAGMSPARYLKHGDVVEASIEGLGAQRQRVRTWGAGSHVEEAEWVGLTR